MTRNTSAVAFSRSSASSRSRRSRADSLSARTVGTLRRFGVAAFRRRDLTDPALERPRMAFPEAQETHRSGSNWQVGSGFCNVRFGSEADIEVGSRHVRYSPESGH